MNTQNNTQLTIVEKNKSYLAQALQNSAQLLQTLSAEMQEEFKRNFLELASNDYLLSKVAPKELIQFCIGITKLGLNINPAYKEVYIVPFNTKVGNTKIMLPQAIIPLNGMQEMAYDSGFYLRLYEVWDFGSGNVVSEKGMERKYQRMLKTSNPKWVDEHFFGFDIELVDIKGEIPDQYKFVEASYLKEVTKTLKDERFKVQTWRHKAVRRAFGDFFIPRGRTMDVITKLEHLNDGVLDSVNPEHNPKTLEQLGIKTIEKDGLLIAQGNTYGKTPYLKQMGFVFSHGKWVKAASTTIDQQPQQSQEDKSIKLKEAKKELAKLFNKFGLPKERQKEFVVNFLGISGDDLTGIKQALSNQEALQNAIESFLSEPIIIENVA